MYIGHQPSKRSLRLHASSRPTRPVDGDRIARPLDLKTVVPLMPAQAFPDGGLQGQIETAAYKYKFHKVSDFSRSLH